MDKNYYLWGIGGVGKRALKYLKPFGIIEGIIDNDINKHGQILYGLTVKGYDDVKHDIKKSHVIITYFGSEETEELLSRNGVKFWRLSEFISYWFWENRSQNALGFLDFPITTRCSLNCKDCMQYIPYRSKQDIPIIKLKHDLDSLFKCVSFIGEISIIGGEPFLHKHLTELLKYINENYIERIGSLVITTNGTIIPNLHTLNKCYDVDAFISISDYSEALPKMQETIEELITVARKKNISIERKNWKWVDPGRFDQTDQKIGCTQTHKQLVDEKIWQCTLMAAGCMANLCTVDSECDYYDLRQVNHIDFHDFINKKTTVAYTSQCGKCLYPKKIPIPCAIQVRKETK